MRIESPNPNGGALNELLSEWKIDSALPPRFSEQVWKRIERDANTTATPFELLRNWMTHAALRPAFAVSYAAILLGVGLTTGYWQAHVRSERATETLGIRYVQIVDPYQRIHR